jgi:hypothetical protein
MLLLINDSLSPRLLIKLTLVSFATKDLAHPAYIALFRAHRDPTDLLSFGYQIMSDPVKRSLSLDYIGIR